MPEPRADTEAPPHQETYTNHRTSSSDGTATYNDKNGPTTAALVRNPLEGMTEADVLADVDKFVEEKGLQEHGEVFRSGALLARVIHTEDAFEQVTAISEQERDVLRREITHKWSQPFMLYFLCTLCAGSAVVQGMDQTAVNGAQVGSRACFQATSVKAG
jgi:hypothetical protein